MRTPIYLLSFAFLMVMNSASAKLDKDTIIQVNSVLQRATTSGDHHVRAVAVGIYSRLKPKETKAVAIDALKDPVWAVRAAAINALIKIKSKAYKTALMDAMTNPRRSMSREIMPVLNSLSVKEAVALSHKLLKDQNATTKNELIEAWGSQDGARRTAFFKPLLTHKDVSLKERVQDYVLGLSGKDVLKLVETVLKHGNAALRDKALDALAKFPKGTKMTFLRSLAKSKDLAVKVRAAEVMAHHGDKSAKKVLLPILSSKNDEQIVRALSALGNIASKDMFPALKLFIRARNVRHDIVEKALEIHYRAGDPKLLDTLRRLRRNDNMKIQAHAIYYLGLLEKGRGLPALHEDLFHGDPNVRMAAIRAVGGIGSRESIAHLKRALDNTPQSANQLREAIVKSLAGISDKDIVPIVQFLLTDRHAGVRKWAIIGLTNVRHRDAVQSLEIALSDSNIAARTEALKAIMLLDKSSGLISFRRALGWLPPKAINMLSELIKSGIVPYLDMALTSSRPGIRDAARKALSSYKKLQEVTLVSALGRTRDNSVKIEILTRLTEINGKKELVRLQTFADSKEIALREAVYSLMGTIGNKGADPILKKALYESTEKTRVAAAVGLLRLYRKIKN